jgi:hypothetical protein
VDQPRDVGLFGCYVDVLPVLTEKCTAERTCSLDVGGAALVREAPECAQELEKILEVGYVCVKGEFPPLLGKDLTNKSNSRSPPQIITLLKTVLKM